MDMPELKELRRAIILYRKNNSGERPSIIYMRPEVFDMILLVMDFSVGEGEGLRLYGIPVIKDSDVEALLLK